MEITSSLFLHSFMKAYNYFYTLHNSYYEKFTDGMIKKIDVPYEIPNGWEWTNLGELSKSEGGKTPSTANKKFWKNGHVLWVTSKDMKSDLIDSSQKMMTSFGLTTTKLIPKNSLLIVTRSGILKHTFPVSILKKNATINQDLKGITFFLSGLEEFYFIVFKALNDKIISDYKKDGTTVDSVNFDLLKKMVIPIPPVEEQRRIVDSVYEMSLLVSNIETSQESLRELASQLRGKVLDIAMQGKLVPQDPSDEPASVLLEKIRAEKQKLYEEGKLKKKDLEETTIIKGDDNAYYRNIPESWSLKALGNLYSVTSSKRVKKDEWSKNGIPFYRAREIVALKKNRDLKDPIFISEATYGTKISVSGEPKAKDILVTGVGTLGITYIVPANHKFYFKDGNVVWLKFLGSVNSKFIEKVLESPRLVHVINNTSGTTVGTLTIDKTKTLPIPVPPIVEQNRIITILNRINKQLSKLLY